MRPFLFTFGPMAATATAPAPSAGSQIATGAATTAGAAMAGPLGAAIGGALGNLIGGIFGGGGKTFAQASTEIHNWFRSSAHSQAFLDWMKANHPRAFTDVDTIKKLQWIYLLQHDRNVNPQGAIVMVGTPRYFIGNTRQATEAFFRELGIDLAASDAKEKQRDPNWQAGSPSQWVNFIHPSSIVYTSPSPQAVQEVQRVVDKKDRGEPLTNSEREIDRSMNKAAGFDLGLGSLVPLMVLALLLFFIFRK